MGTAMLGGGAVKEQEQGGRRLGSALVFILRAWQVLLLGHQDLMSPNQRGTRALGKGSERSILAGGGL